MNTYIAWYTMEVPAINITSRSKSWDIHCYGMR